MAWHETARPSHVLARPGAGLGATALLAVGPLGLAAAGASTTLVGYNATTLAIGTQFAFNVPGVVPLPNENLIEDDAPFARTNVSDGPVVDALSAPYYPGDIAASLGSLLATFGYPGFPLNDPLLAEAKYPTSPGYAAHATFGVPMSTSTPAQPSVFNATSDATSGGGDATAYLSDLALDPLSTLPSLPAALTGPSTSGSLVDLGNVSATDSVTVGSSSITASSTSQIKALSIAGLVDIAALTSTASSTSDGTTGTPTASLHLGQVTVDGQSAYIDGTGVHIDGTGTASSGVTPAQMQQTVDTTLAQDGISIQLLNPTLTHSGAQASADAGGLVVSIAHQFDVPFVPGEPTIPVPELGNVGLPAGIYNATTSITFGLAQTSVTATGLVSEITPQLPTTTTPAAAGTFGTADSFGSGFGATGSLGGSPQSVAANGPGSAAGSGTPTATSATDFPFRGIPPPLGWTITALLATFLVAYPMLLLARWQFVGTRRR